MRERGGRLREGLEALDGVREVRGRGLMIGIGLEEGLDSATITADLLGRGRWSMRPSRGPLRLLPPLTIDAAQVDRAVALIGESLLSFAR